LEIPPLRLELVLLLTVLLVVVLALLGPAPEDALLGATEPVPDVAPALLLLLPNFGLSCWDREPLVALLLELGSANFDLTPWWPAERLELGGLEPGRFPVDWRGGLLDIFSFFNHYSPLQLRATSYSTSY